MGNRTRLGIHKSCLFYLGSKVLQQDGNYIFIEDLKMKL